MQEPPTPDRRRSDPAFGDAPPNRSHADSQICRRVIECEPRRSAALGFSFSLQLTRNLVRDKLAHERLDRDR
jgi:hypothetical protein